VSRRRHQTRARACRQARRADQWRAVHAVSKRKWFAAMDVNLGGVCVYDLFVTVKATLFEVGILGFAGRKCLLRRRKL
jgi:hypothetical protein